MKDWTDIEAYPNNPVMRKIEMRDTPVPANKPRPQMSPRGRITLLGDDLWVLRSVRTRPNGKVDVYYYMTLAMWTSAPSQGTLFTDYGAAETHLLQCDKARAARGWADGSTEVFEVVPLLIEINKSPNSRQIKAGK